MTGRRSLVVGYGVTGRSVTRHLLSTGDRVVVWDDDPAPGMAQAAQAAGSTLVRTPSTSDLTAALLDFDIVVPSPGVPMGHPVLTRAAQLGIAVRSEIDLAFDLPPGDRPDVLAVTGTNGKTTVTTLVAEMLNRSGVPAVAAGNIGLPMVDAVQMDVRVVVAEVSSFQLQFSQRFHPKVSCWLNLAEDHLDWHASLADYRLAKARIWARQGPGDTAVVNAEDQEVVSASRSIPDGVDVTWFSTAADSDFSIRDGRLVGPGGLCIATLSDLPRAFPHDLSNALAATAVALAGGALAQACRDVLRESVPLPHRVTLVGNSDGVAWYDDSKATTPASVRAAVAGFSSVVLIAGGRNKGLDLGVLGGLVPPVRSVIAIGEAAPEVAAAFAGRVPVTTAASMDAAVAAAAEVALPGDAVLLSPGCASFDWYRSYGERGDHFASIVGRRLRREEC